MNVPAEHPSTSVARTAAELGRATIHGLAWSLLVVTLAPSGVAFAAFLGGFGGCLLGSKLARTPDSARMSPLSRQ